MLHRIAVHMDLGKHCETRLETAMALARTHSAELLGIYAAPHLNEYTLGESVALFEGLKLVRQQEAQHQKAVEQRFRDLTGNAGISAQWRVAIGIPEEAVAVQARNTELLIVSQPASAQSGGAPAQNFIETLLLSLGRPVLALPDSPQPDTIGKRALYCWDRGQPSARAIADAAPILREADELHVLTMDEQSKSDHGVPFDDLAAYCRAMGYPEPQLIERTTKGHGVGETILNTATDASCDLIVMGAYGHSRMRQMILGGATSSLLKSMTMPVLFSH